MTTIDYKNMIQKDCIFLNLKDADRHELFEQVGEKLKHIGYVKDTYVDALNEREAEFPTGLMTKYLPISLPHVDSVNVNRAFIAVVKNDKPIHMLQMGSNEDMQCEYFFFLGITDSSHQVILLQKFMQLLRDKSFVDRLICINNVDDMFEFMQEKFN